ncbi:MAG: hypothetical protein ACPGO3_03475 [Magnetospiraceae bacterium]
MKLFRVFPLLSITLILYNGAVFLAGADIAGSIGTITLFSGAEWTLTLGDLLIMVSVALLFAEILKSTSTRNTALLDHGLSFLVFVVALVEFLIVPACGTSVFFIFLLMSALDVIGGFTVSMTSARRDWGGGSLTG